MSEMLSQKEIDDLVAKAAGQGCATAATDAATAAAADEISLLTALTAVEIDTLGEIGNISMGAAATALYAILGRQVMITTPTVVVTSMEKLAAVHNVPFLVVDVGYTEGFRGSSMFILQLEDVKVITDIMMGGDGHPGHDELTELHISAISEAMNQMMGGMATAMAEMFNRIVNISPPNSTVVKLSDDEIRSKLSRDQEALISISFKMEIEGLIDSRIMQLVPLDFGRRLVNELFGGPSAHLDVQTTQTIPDLPILATAAGPAYPHPARPMMPDKLSRPARPVPSGQLDAAAPAAPAAPAVPAAPVAPAARQQALAAPARLQPPIDIRPIMLTSFDDPGQTQAAGNDNGIGLILDVPLQITVELGQCRKTIKDILDLNIGSVVTLDKLAGEPVDIVVNGKPVAKGEVIVIDDSYGVRITEVLSAAGRFRTGR